MEKGRPASCAYQAHHFAAPISPPAHVNRVAATHLVSKNCTGGYSGRGSPAKDQLVVVIKANSSPRVGSWGVGGRAWARPRVCWVERLVVAVCDIIVCICRIVAAEAACVVPD